ncbi:TPA: hypothetical protein DCZ39_01780 [Patescibacteria group bacterium]|nr:hypothetical protein [Candidatus Gracilibacteria bacterium]
MLDAIRNETVSEHHLSLFNKQVGEAHTDAILLSTHRGRVDDINNKKISELPGKEYIYESDTE